MFYYAGKVSDRAYGVGCSSIPLFFPTSLSVSFQLFFLFCCPVSIPPVFFVFFVVVAFRLQFSHQVVAFPSFFLDLYSGLIYPETGNQLPSRTGNTPYFICQYVIQYCIVHSVLILFAHNTERHVPKRLQKERVSKSIFAFPHWEENYFIHVFLLLSFVCQKPEHHGEQRACVCPRPGSRATTCMMTRQFFAGLAVLSVLNGSSCKVAADVRHASSSTASSSPSPSAFVSYHVPVTASFNPFSRLGRAARRAIPGSQPERRVVLALLSGRRRIFRLSSLSPSEERPPYPGWSGFSCCAEKNVQN